MPDWPIHLIVPLLALLIAGKKENHKFIFLLLPLAVIPDFDGFVTLHRALLHNIFIPLLLLLLGLMIKKERHIFVIASAYLTSHILLDTFGGGVVLFYPISDAMAFVDASLKMTPANNIIWTFNYGFRQYRGSGFENGYGFISDSIGTASMLFVLLACVCVAYRNHRETT